MVKTKNEELFKTLMSNDFNLGEYNFETPYGSVKLVKFIENNVNKDFVKVELSLNGILILTLKDSKNFPEGLVECLYWKKDNDNLEIYNIVDKEDFTMHGRLSKSCFHRIEIANNHLYGITDKFFSSIAAELYDDVIFCYDCPIVYDLNEKQFYLNIDIDGKWYNTLINSNTTVAAELEKIKNKMKELKDLNALGHLAFDLVQKYIFEDIDLEDLESCEKGFRELVEFYNKYYVNREAIYEKLDSNPVFKLLEVQVKEIFQEKEKNNQTLTRSKEL